jgi:hypothetical protein
MGPGVSEVRIGRRDFSQPFASSHV